MRSGQSGSLQQGSSSRTHVRPPRLSLTTFVARPPDLQRWPLMDGGLSRLLSARPARTAYYPISVRRAAILLHAAFRPRLATTPLRFANPSPPPSWIRDLHPQVEKHAWQTTPHGRQPLPPVFSCAFPQLLLLTNPSPSAGHRTRDNLGQRIWGAASDEQAVQTVWTCS